MFEEWPMTTIVLSDEGRILRQDTRGRVGQNRVTLESGIGLFEQGATAEEITRRFDALDPYATLRNHLDIASKRKPICTASGKPSSRRAARPSRDHPRPRTASASAAIACVAMLRLLADENLDGNILRASCGACRAWTAFGYRISGFQAPRTRRFWSGPPS